MEAVAATAAPAVEQLAARTRAGDRQAFVSVCAPHFERVFDFVLRLVRDRSMAADVSRSVFAQARDHEEFQEAKPWLYAVARSTALAALRDRRGPRGTGQREREGLDFTRVDADRLSDVSRVLFDREFVELVWDSAATLSPEDYSLLDLHVRQDLAAEALDEHLGLETGSAQIKLSRLRAGLDEEVTAVLLARRASRNCAQLDLALSNLGDVAAKELCRAVERHVRECRMCQESGRSFVSPTEVFGALATMPAPQGLRKELLEVGRSRRKRRFGTPAARTGN